MFDHLPGLDLLCPYVKLNHSGKRNHSKTHIIFQNRSRRLGMRNGQTKIHFLYNLRYNLAIYTCNMFNYFNCPNIE